MCVSEAALEGRKLNLLFSSAPALDPAEQPPALVGRITLVGGTAALAPVEHALEGRDALPARPAAFLIVTASMQTRSCVTRACTSKKSSPRTWASFFPSRGTRRSLRPFAAPSCSCCCPWASPCSGSSSFDSSSLTISQAMPSARASLLSLLQQKLASPVAPPVSQGRVRRSPQRHCSSGLLEAALLASFHNAFHNAFPCVPHWGKKTAGVACCVTDVTG